MIRIIYVFIGILFCVSTLGQKKLTLDQVIAGGHDYYDFIPERLNVSFQGDANYLVLRDITELRKKAIEGGEEVVLFTLNQLNEWLVEKGLKKVQVIPKGEWYTNSLYRFKTKNSYVTIDVDSKCVSDVKRIPYAAKVIEYHMNSNQLAFVREGNIYILDDNDEESLVEKSDSKDIVLGKSVHRYEFGIHKGLFWSSNGKRLAFYGKDESMVTDYPLVNIDKRVATLENIKYPMAGMASHHVALGVYDLKTQKVTYMKTGLPKDKYLTNVSWAPDENSVFIAELNREQNHMSFNQYDVATGEKINTLFEEKSDTWVEPENPALFLPNRDDMFIWQSERDGYNHLYLYSTSGKLLKQLTKGDWQVTDIKGFDVSGKYLFFESTQESVLERHLYRLTLSNGDVHQITNEKGIHKVEIHPSGKYFIDEYSNQNTPRNINVIDNSGKLLLNLHQAKNPYEDFELGKISIEKIISEDDSTELYARLILPPNFDSSKKYPVILYVYGGPHSQLVRDNWLASARGWQLYMAQKGYICFTLDNRGTSYRGVKFEKVIHRQLGECEMGDQMKGIEFLTSLPYVDSERIGVHGWSYGGFMTINLMEKYPEVFKVGVSGGPVIDWKYYEIMYGERYMDMPEENPKGYENSCLNNRVSSLQGRLLVIHGAIDPTVVWQNSLTFIEACIEEGKQVDYFVYPRHEHNVLGKDRIHLMQKVTQYFDDFL